MGRKPINRAKEQEIKVEVDNVNVHGGVYHTNSGHKITAKEELFIQNICRGKSPFEAYKLAGYSGEKSDGYTKSDANNLLKVPKIAEEIKYRLDQLKDESIADAKEIMQYYTRVMRGQEKDQFQLDAPLSERTSAAKELMKSVIEVEEKAAGNSAPELKITLDWARDGKKED